MPRVKGLESGFGVDVSSLVPKLNSNFGTIYFHNFEGEISIRPHLRNSFLLELFISVLIKNEIALNPLHLQVCFLKRL